MYEKTDFKNPLDWVKYQITGKAENLLKTEQKFELKFYEDPKSKTERGTVYYKGKRLCCIYKNQFDEVNKDFNKDFNGENFNSLKKKYGKKYHLVNKTRRGRKKVNRLKDTNLIFSDRNGRVEVRARLKGKTHHICSCNPDEVKTIIKEYNSLKKDKNQNIESIKSKLSSKYSRNYGVKNKVNEITINSNGLIYRDGKFVKTNQNLYNLINSMM